jgi:hypothetical protein
MAGISIPSVFISGERALASEVNANFDEIRDFINSTTVHSDGLNFPSSLPLVPAVSENPSSANQLYRKAYVDAQVAAEATARAALPQGVIGLASVTTTQVYAGTSTFDVTGAAVEVSLVQGRRYRLSAYVPAQGLGGTNFVARLFVTDAAGLQLQLHAQDVRNTTDRWSFTPSFVFTAPSTATVTYKLRATAEASASWQTVPTGFGPLQLVVEDLGLVSS